MQGTDKQVTWANDIKAAQIASVRSYFAASYARAEKAGQGEQFRKVVADVIALMEAEESADWWISNSKTDAKTLLTPFYKRVIGI